jgi:hypothetical protein
MDPHIVDGKRLSPWSVLCLDRETNSYSLSKFQLFVVRVRLPIWLSLSLALPLAGSVGF